MEVIIEDHIIRVLPFALVVLAAMLLVLWHRSKNPAFLLCCAIFGIYLLFVIELIFFPIRISESYVRDVRWFSSINLIPLNFNFSELPRLVLQQIVLNVLLTVPFGFGMRFVAQIRAKQVLWIALAVGAAIETGQLLISVVVRYPYRTIDVNDVLLNALGVVVGYGVFRIFARLYTGVTKRYAIQHSGLTAYIHTIASQTR